MASGDWWRRLVGSARRLGLWTLPAFLVVGLAGAVMAGGLAVVYYSQQVSGLEAETRESREQLNQAVEDVQKAGEDALAAIEDEVESVRESLTREVPIDEINDLGVVVIRALVGSQPPPAPPPADDGTETQGAPDVQAAAQEEPPASEQPTQQPTEPAPAPPSPRVGVGFAVAADGPTTFFATSFGLVADGDARAGVVEAVEIVTANGTFRGVVHSWDDGRDLALVRAEVGQVRIAEWRPSEQPLAVGERLTIAGLTPTLDAVFLNAVVGYADVTMVVADIPTVGFLRGAPLVDQAGNLVAVYTLGYRPFGAQAGDGQAVAPVGLLCERMLRNCEELEANPSETVTEP